MLHKKITFLVGLVGSVLFGASLFAEPIGLCKLVSLCERTFDPLAEILLPVVCFFIFSCITYFTSEALYRSWFKFARWWVPLSVAVIAISPEYSHDWMFKIEKDTFAYGFSVVFIFVSILIILIAKLRK